MIKETTLGDLSDNGTIVLPVLFNQLHGLHAPQKIVGLFDFMPKYMQRLQNRSIDVVLLYTDGLFAELGGIGVRKHLNNAMVSHRNAVRKGIRSKGWDSQGFQFVTWNQNILLTDKFIPRYVQLEKLMKRHEALAVAAKQDLKNLGLPDQDPGPLMEMLVAHSLVRDLQGGYTKQMSQETNWSLLAYQGPRLNAEEWLLQGRHLKEGDKNVFGSHIYLAQSDKLLVAV